MKLVRKQARIFKVINSLGLLFGLLGLVCHVVGAVTLVHLSDTIGLKLGQLNALNVFLVDIRFVSSSKVDASPVLSLGNVFALWRLDFGGLDSSLAEQGHNDQVDWHHDQSADEASVNLEWRLLSPQVCLVTNYGSLCLPVSSRIL